jgi:vancomycin resistance protein YoaR
MALDWSFQGADATIADVRRMALMLVMLVASVGLGIGAAHWHARWLPGQHALPGTLVGDCVPPRDRLLSDWLEQRRQQLLEREAIVQLPDELLAVTFRELGIELDVAATLEQVLGHAQRGGWWERLERALAARRGHEQLALMWSFDQARARVLLGQLAHRVYRAPVNARLDLRSHRRIEHEFGRRLDVPESLRRLASGAREAFTVFQLATQPIAADVTSDMLLQIDVSQVLSSFETSFRGKAGPRAANIATAAHYLNGTVLQPDQTLSFNQVVGPRREDRGFTWAPVIVEDEMEPGVGGGVCQLATTLHGAAVYGLLDITQRRSHSRPSGYAPLGLDATVIDDEVDLKLRNPYDTALLVHAFLPGDDTVRVEFLGRPPPGKVRHRYAVVETHDFTRRVRVMPELASDRPQRRQKGQVGYEILSFVTVSYPDGTAATRHYKSKYYPVPEVYWVASSDQLDALPDLPEGAEGVELWEEEREAGALEAGGEPPAARRPRRGFDRG